MLPPDFADAIRAIAGAAHVRVDDDSRITYGTDALKRGRPADLVVLPGTAEEVAAVVRVCAAHRIPFVPRGAGTGAAKRLDNRHLRSQSGCHAAPI